MYTMHGDMIKIKSLILSWIRHCRDGKLMFPHEKSALLRCFTKIPPFIHRRMLGQKIPP